MLKYPKFKTKALSLGDKDIVSKEIIKEIGRDISMHILGIDIQGEVTLVDKEWTRVKNEIVILFLKMQIELSISRYKTLIIAIWS
jgi:hypothetical protein